MARQQSTSTRVRAIVEEARGSGQRGADFEALALIAEVLARIVDAAKDDPGRQLAALKDLRATFEQMELGSDDGGSAGGSGAAGDDAGGDDPRAREMAELMGAGPTSGDAADA